jgi:hypothetical protein
MTQQHGENNMATNVITQAISKHQSDCGEKNDLKYIKRVGPLSILFTVLTAISFGGAAIISTASAREDAEQTKEITYIKTDVDHTMVEIEGCKTTIDTLKRIVDELRAQNAEIKQMNPKLDQILAKLK